MYQLRALQEVSGVLRVAHPTSALRWVAQLVPALPQILRSRSLAAADAGWRRGGARFRTPSGRTVLVPGVLTAGAREMFCRNVYLRTGLTIPPGGWVVDLGANVGLFTVLAATEGAKVVAVEAQHGFAREIARLVDLNSIEPGQVHVETALAAATDPQVALVGTLADAQRWQAASHAAPHRPGHVSIPELIYRYGIDRVSLLKIDIEGGEFSVFDEGDDLSWLAQVDQIAMEVHPQFGDVPSVCSVLRRNDFGVRITDDAGRIVTADSPQIGYLYTRRQRN